MSASTAQAGPDLDRLLRHLAAAPAAVPAVTDVDAWWRGFGDVMTTWASPFERAVAGGFAADRMAWAFCAGYQAALRAVLPTLPDQAIAAMCASEAGGNAPRTIRTRLSDDGGGLHLSGRKTWTTLGPAASVLLVVARVDGSPDERPALKVVRVAGDAPGVRLEPMPPTRFVPEAPHAQVALERVAVTAADLLPGDGYDAWLKPFRTVEDVYVQAAILAWIAREARSRDWPQAAVEQASALIVALSALAALSPASPATHVALAGVLTQVDAYFAQVDGWWAGSGDAEAVARWQRDRTLTRMAGPVREARRASAWGRVSARSGTAG